MAHNNDGIGRIQKGTYYIPQLLHDINVNKFMQEAAEDMISGYKQIQILQNKLIISTSDSQTMDIKNSSIDYCFTDPPYAEKVQYGELNFVWEAWLNFDTHWHDDEIIINETRGKTENDWRTSMFHTMQECYRILKPGRCISLCYHDTSEGTWSVIQDIMAHAGFIPEQISNVLYIDAPTKTTNQYFADKVNKRDLVINFRKPKPDETTSSLTLTGDEDNTTFAEKVRRIISDYLNANPGSTKDRIFDEVVSRMVRRGQMEAHDFNGLLRSVAEEVKTPVKKDLFRNEEPNLFGTHEISRWYPRETESTVDDAAENAREDAAAAVLSAFIREFLMENPADEGVHYSELFERYIYAVKDKPRRQMADFLPDYFYKTDDGAWRLPLGEDEEKAKREGRAQGLGRNIKRYIAMLESGAGVTDRDRPTDATLAAWLRHCKRSGLYAEGRLLYEKGGLNTGNLSDELMAALDEDYQTCIRMLARKPASGGGKG